MKLQLIAVVVGVALAIAMLGIDGREAESGELSSRFQPQSVDLPMAASPHEPDAPRQPASHLDSNTEAVEMALNANLISGRPTLVCTSSRDLFDNLKEAVDIWNEALQDSSVRPVAEARAEPSRRRSLR